MHSEVYGVHGQVEFPQRGRWGKCLQEGRQPALDLQPGYGNHWSNKLQWFIRMCSQFFFFFGAALAFLGTSGFKGIRLSMGGL